MIYSDTRNSRRITNAFSALTLRNGEMYKQWHQDDHWAPASLTSQNKYNNSN